jgi:hypothetical protein
MSLFRPEDPKALLPADAADALRRIDALLDEDRLWDVSRDRLDGMATWIREHRAVNDAMLTAIGRIEDGLDGTRRSRRYR